MLIVLIIIVCIGIFILFILTSAHADEISVKEKKIKELQDMLNTFMEKNEVYEEANVKAEDIIKNAEKKAGDILEKVKYQADSIKSDAKIEASSVLREAIYKFDRHRIDEMMADVFPDRKDSSNATQKTKKEYTKEYFKGRYDEKKIPAEYLKPKVDIEFINNPLARRKIVITGDLEQIFRTDLAEELWQLGADIDSTIGKNTNMLIVGKDPGPKKMDQLNEFTQIETVNEEELIALLMLADDWKSSVDKLAGMTFFIAGELHFFTGPNIKLLILDNGGKVASRISGKVNYVLLGDSPDYKVIDEAEKAMINFVSEEDLLKILDIKISIREYL